ncbi:MAG: acetolactate synthase [Paenibacillaceae bacterium]|jgi:acetolactate synthase-1/2/3 large subunit|nr:acetolactate synthase [Paenibacillaceae bacterium]
MKLSDYVIDFIRRQGVAHIFEMTGGAIVHLLDSTYDRTDIGCVSVHHEQAAAFAAEGYSRMNGKLGVAMATSGPGALNLLTGIGSCYFDSVPCLFISGQVNTYEYKFDTPVRQVGFQETDIVNIVKPIAKLAEMVLDPRQIRYLLEKAVFVAGHGRPGPVLLDIPMNIQRAQIEPDTLPSFYGSAEYSSYPDFKRPCPGGMLEQTVQLLAQAKRPLILAGGGVRAGDAAEDLRRLAELAGIPVVSSLMGLDVLPGVHPLSLGLIGSYGNRYSNLAVANCDFLLVLGSRLDTRQTGTRPDTFARGAKKVHVDVEDVAQHGRVKADITVSMDVKQFLADFAAALSGRRLPVYAEWHNILQGWRSRYPSGEARPAAAGSAAQEATAAGSRELAGSAAQEADAASGKTVCYPAVYPASSVPSVFPASSVAITAGGSSAYSAPGPAGASSPSPGTGSAITPNRFMELLSSHTSDGAVVVLDVGQHQMWASQSFRLREGQRLLNAGGMGAMGFALPAAIGAAMAAPDRQIIVIAGDGGIQVNLQELHTVVQRGLPLKIFVMNNHSLGMVRQFQDTYMDGRQQSTVKGYGCPDLVKVASAFGMPALRIEGWQGAAATIGMALRTPGSFLVEVNLDAQTAVVPKLLVNRPVEDMSPPLPRNVLAAEMLIQPLADEGESS